MKLGDKIEEAPSSDELLSEADRRSKIAILGLARHTLEKARDMVTRLEHELGLDEKGKVD